MLSLLQIECLSSAFLARDSIFLINIQTLSLFETQAVVQVIPK